MTQKFQTETNMLLSTQNKGKISVFELALFSMYGALMFASKLIMEFLPNMHLIGVFVVLFTIVYRKKALIPIYVFVLLTGFFYGFGIWWVPYLYIWTILWAFAMLVPKKLPRKAAFFVFPVICSLHGLLYGTLYAPFQAIVFGLNFKQTVAWIIAGIPFDITHCISNLIVGLLIVPLSDVLIKAHNTAK